MDLFKEESLHLYVILLLAYTYPVRNEDLYRVLSQHIVFLWFLTLGEGLSRALVRACHHSCSVRHSWLKATLKCRVRPAEITQRPPQFHHSSGENRKETTERRKIRDINSPKLRLLMEGREEQHSKKQKNVYALSHSFCLPKEGTCPSPSETTKSCICERNYTI